MNSDGLKEYLRQEGADLVGVGDITQALAPDIMHLNRGVAIAVNRGLNRSTVDMLVRLQHLTEGWLRAKGYRSLSIPPDSDRKKGTYISKLYGLLCHKTAATCSGLGWVGKNGLVINRVYGSRLSWATVLTNAPLKADGATVRSECGECELCVKHCPSGAINGRLWSIAEPMQEMVAYEKCASFKRQRNNLDGKPNCGFCVTVCPYTRNEKKNRSQRQQMDFQKHHRNQKTLSRRSHR